MPASESGSAEIAGTFLPVPVMSTVMLSSPQKTFDGQKIKTYTENSAICSVSNTLWVRCAQGVPLPPGES